MLKQSDYHSFTHKDGEIDVEPHTCGLDVDWAVPMKCVMVRKSQHVGLVGLVDRVTNRQTEINTVGNSHHQRLAWSRA